MGYGPLSRPDARPSPRLAAGLTAGWKARLESLRAAPFRGVTTDGQIVPGLFAQRDESAPTAAILAAVTDLFRQLSPEQVRTIKHPIGSLARRLWVNEVLRYERFGIWLDELTPAVCAAAIGVLRASLSAAGFEQSRNIMRLNGFLGELVGAPIALGEVCYQLHVFGEPSAAEPWGWQLFGHHRCITCFIVGTQMTLTPTFMGAEPRCADAGQHAGGRVFDDEERIGLAFIRSLSAAQQRKAIVYETTVASGLPPGRHQGPDDMSLAASFKDNAVIPHEGTTGAELDPGQGQLLLDLTEQSLSSLPPGPLRARMNDVERHLAETPFCWAAAWASKARYAMGSRAPL